MSAIRAISLTKKFGDFIANDKINLSVSEGEIHCIVGENGAGKSTLMNILYGLLIPNEGKIFIHENEVILRNPLDAIYNGVGMVHQHFNLVPSLKVYENIFLGTEINRKIGNKNPFTIPIVNKKLEKDKVHELMKKYGFDINVTNTVDNLSVGEKQKVEILKMLYRNVDILILDEPTAVLAPQEVDELIIRFKQLKRQDRTKRLL